MASEQKRREKAEAKKATCYGTPAPTERAERERWLLEAHLARRERDD
jgi:hypothetical protein